MTISAVDMFSIGIGPSSSHTVGPMRAAEAFMAELGERRPDAALIRVEFRGSLAATGRGHGTDRATLLGLVGWTPTTVTPDVAPYYGTPIAPMGTITGPSGTVNYELIFDFSPVPEHPNCVIFSALDAEGAYLIQDSEYFSVGGGFILSRREIDAQLAATKADDAPLGMAAAAHTEETMPYPFRTWSELLAYCTSSKQRIADVMLANEAAIHGTTDYTLAHLDAVWAAMQDCVAAGLDTDGILPGGLQVQRRAPDLLNQLKNRGQEAHDDALYAMDWINLYALAVNEQNAGGGRVVTAPTNGAAGIIPAVMHYAKDFLAGFDDTKARRFLLTAAAIGIIIKESASISGAEVGCQGEVGSASAMAAAGLCALMGGTTAQVGNAAEIALEHNLGLTCDPVGGLVQIPCIERNAIGGVKAVNAARLALYGTGVHRVSLDDAVATMAETGRDMLTKYKETSMGGLAIRLGFPVSQTEC
ncbi:L-serine ammonia-lyase [Corynebacterium uterequi]|uniref:L-serine dehydratase n=1 Tax=Corynebacterium uterequi TaxID=1072256 RepID=A0A0G3HCY7_9CORY|nr:L-serine ammonia-lyase [Corynebacterium uterequi]AKK11226.1 L-serine dehydratase, iron-sulfur-dependent, single chain form [Corynebacterium uterequi]